MFFPFLAGALTQGIAARRSAKADRQQQQLLAQQVANNNDNYYQQLHASSMNSPQVQAQIAQVRQLSEKQNGTNANTAIAGNMTREQQLAGNQQTARNVAAAVNQIGAAQAGMQQQIRQQHVRDTQQTTAEMRKQKQQQAQRRSQLGQNLARSLVTALAYNHKS